MLNVCLLVGMFMMMVLQSITMYLVVETGNRMKETFDESLKRMDSFNEGTSKQLGHIHSRLSVIIARTDNFIFIHNNFTRLEQTLMQVREWINRQYEEEKTNAGKQRERGADGPGQAPAVRSRPGKGGVVGTQPTAKRTARRRTEVRKE